MTPAVEQENDLQLFEKALLNSRDKAHLQYCY